MGGRAGASTRGGRCGLAAGRGRRAREVGFPKLGCAAQLGGAGTGCVCPPPLPAWELVRGRPATLHVKLSHNGLRRSILRLKNETEGSQIEEAPKQTSEVAPCPPQPPQPCVQPSCSRVCRWGIRADQSPDTAVRGHPRTHSLAINPHRSHEGFFGQPGDHKAGPRGTAGRGVART